MHLTLHLTRACNLRCDYCYAPPRPDAGMSFETGRQALLFGARLTAGSCGIIFFGGEPLLHKELIYRLVAEADLLAQRGQGQFHFKVTTNGLLLDEDFLEFSIRHDVLIALSFDGVRDAHDRHRRRPDGTGSYELLLPKLRALLATRPFASVLLVVNPDTIQYLADSVTWLLDEGCRYLIVSLNYAADWSEAALAALAEQYERLGQLYIEWSRQGRKFYLSPFEVKLASHILGAEARCQRCELGVRQLSVDPQGYLFPCVQFTAAGKDSRWRIGHVATGLDEVARARLRDESQREKEPCCQCALRNRCQNTCGCLNWQTTGTVDRISPVLCRHEQLLIAIADRVGAILYQERNPRFLQKHYDPAYPILSFLEDYGA
jgi:uncharacterized protein